MVIYHLEEVLSVKISEVINMYGEKYTPYMSGLVNHLPMGQLALYKMTNNIDKVQIFTKNLVSKSKIDLVLEDYPRCRSIRHCLGKRYMYESCLDLVKKDLNHDNLEEYVAHILNTYPLGMSSGLFHTIIRMYYALEGYKIDKDLIDEVRRASAYYITAYREANLFKRKIKASHIIDEMEKLVHNERIQALIYNEPTTGKKMRALYNSIDYLQAGFVIEGSKDEKVEALLDMLLKLFINSGNIIVLHSITALQALLGLEDYYEDFSKALDILTTTIITHIMTLGDLKFDLREKDKVEFSWKYILSLGSESQNVHNIKFTYSTHELSKSYPVKNLKRATLYRIDTI